MTFYYILKIFGYPIILNGVIINSPIWMLIGMVLCLIEDVVSWQSIRELKEEKEQ